MINAEPMPQFNVSHNKFHRVSQLITNDIWAQRNGLKLNGTNVIYICSMRAFTHTHTHIRSYTYALMLTPSWFNMLMLKVKNIIPPAMCLSKIYIPTAYVATQWWNYCRSFVDGHCASTDPPNALQSTHRMRDRVHEITNNHIRQCMLWWWPNA